jgi:hypothetical protein
VAQQVPYYAWAHGRIQTSLTDGVTRWYALRFEKQCLPFSALLTDQQTLLTSRLRNWVDGLATVVGPGSDAFTRADLFTGYNDDSALESLVVALHGQGAGTGDGGAGLLDLCKVALLCTATADGVVRSLASRLARTHPEEVQALVEGYFADDAHANLAGCLEHVCGDAKRAGARGVKAVVTTFSSLHSLALPAEAEAERCWHRKLGAFDSESLLAGCVHGFYRDEEAEVLMLEMDATYDGATILLARALVDREESEHLAGPRGAFKAVVLVVHVGRVQFDGDSGGRWDACFARGWDFRHCDNLYLELADWQGLRAQLATGDMTDVLTGEGVMEGLVVSELMSSFRRIGYKRLADPRETRPERVLRLCRAIAGGGGFMGLIMQKILPHVLEWGGRVRSGEGAHWLVKVACDRECLELAAFSLPHSVRAYMREAVRDPLTRLLYALERHSALETYAALDEAEAGAEAAAVADFARKAFLCEAFVDLARIRPPVGAQAASHQYEVEVSVPGLRFPFSRAVWTGLEDTRAAFVAEVRRLRTRADEGGQVLGDEDLEPLRERFAGLVHNNLCAVLGAPGRGDVDVDVAGLLHAGGYAQDVLALFSVGLGDGVVVPEVLALVRSLLEAVGAGGDPFRTHVVLWEHAELIQALLPLLGRERRGDNDLALAGDATSLLTLAYEVACEAVDECLGEAVRVGGAVGGAWAAGAERLMGRVARVAGAARLELNRFLCAVDPTLRLLDRLYALKVVVELAGVVGPGEPLPPLAGRAVGDVTTGEDFMAACCTWLRGRESEAAARALSAILERFLYVAAERHYAHGLLVPVDEAMDVEVEEEGEPAPFVCSPVLLTAWEALCALRDRPPVSATNVLHLLLAEVWGQLAGEDDPCGLVREGRLPDPLVGPMGEVEAALAEARDSPLEVMCLDLIEAHYLLDAPAPGEEGDRPRGDAMEVEEPPEARQERIRLFYAAARNLLGGGGEGVLVSWYSHALARRFLRRVARAVERGAPSEEDLQAVNAVLAPGGEPIPGAAPGALLGSLQLYFVKCLRAPDLAALRAACTEGGRYAGLCPWVEALPWGAGDGRLMAFDPFLYEAGVRDGTVAEAWDEAHAYYGRSDDGLRALMAAIEGAEEAGAAVDPALGLLYVAFMRVCTPGTQVYPVRPEAVEVARRLAGSARREVAAAGRVMEAVVGRLVELGPGQGPPQEDLPGGAAALVFLASLCVKLLGLACAHPGNLLARYLWEPEALAGGFVVGAESDVMAAQMRHNPGVTLYRCECGMHYVVDGCGQVTHESTCPTCRRRVGGAQYGRPNPGQTRVGGPAPGGDERGYVVSAEMIGREGHTERSLTPVQYHVLMLLLHAALVAAGLAHGEERMARGVRPPVRLGGKGALVHCWEAVLRSWRALCAAVVPPGREDVMCAALHGLASDVLAAPGLAARGALSTAEARDRWEEAFVGVCGGVLGDPLAAGTARLEGFTREEMPALERDLKELRAPVVGAEGGGLALGFYRVTGDLTYEGMRAAFIAEAANAQRFPVIRLLFEHEERLRLVRHLPALLTWTNVLRRAKNLQLTRDQAREMRHADLWGAGEQTQRTGLTPQAFQAFASAWNGFREEFVLDRAEDAPQRPAVRDGCATVGLLEMQRDTPVLHSCVGHRDEGRVVAAVLCRLAALHNDFLEQCIEAVAGQQQQQQGQAREAGAQVRLEAQGGVQAMVLPLQEARLAVLSALDPQELWGALRQYGRARLEFGRGHEVAFDWPTVQRAVVRALVEGRALLQAEVENLLPLRFVDETFSSDQRLFDVLAERVPQEPILDSDLVRGDRFVQDPREVSGRMLPALEALMYQVRESKGLRFDPATPITQCARDWLDDTNCANLEYYRQVSRSHDSGMHTADLGFAHAEGAGGACVAGCRRSRRWPSCSCGTWRRCTSLWRTQSPRPSSTTWTPRSASRCPPAWRAVGFSRSWSVWAAPRRSRRAGGASWCATSAAPTPSPPPPRSCITWIWCASARRGGWTRMRPRVPRRPRRSAP